MRALGLVVITACSFVHGTAPTGGPGDAPADTRAHDAPLDAPRTCPAGYVTLVGAPATSRYAAFGAETFDTAVSSCAGAGTHLVQLDTPGEVDAVFTYVDAQTTGGDTHLYRVVGKRDTSITPNRWLELDGATQLNFLPWGIGEPTNNAGENCIVVRAETAAPTIHVIGADQCATNHEYACECD